MKQEQRKFIREDDNAIRIDPNSIPNIEKKLLCSTFLEAVIKFYKDPENEKHFQEWEKNRQSSQGE